MGFGQYVLSGQIRSLYVVNGGKHALELSRLLWGVPLATGDEARPFIEVNYDMAAGDSLTAFLDWFVAAEAYTMVPMEIPGARLRGIPLLYVCALLGAFCLILRERPALGLATNLVSRSLRYFHRRDGDGECSRTVSNNLRAVLVHLPVRFVRYPRRDCPKSNHWGTADRDERLILRLVARIARTTMSNKRKNLFYAAFAVVIAGVFAAVTFHYTTRESDPKGRGAEYSRGLPSRSCGGHQSRQAGERNARPGNATRTPADRRHRGIFLGASRLRPALYDSRAAGRTPDARRSKG